MSLPKDSQEKLFTATNELQGFLPDDDPMTVFSTTIYPVFKDEEFTDCYSTKGRNAISPAFLACTTLLQFRENLSDTETAEACVRRLDWKIALHLPIGQNVSFDSSTLCYFRKRLKENDKMSLIFDKIVKLAQEKGFIKKRTKQRIDATHIISHVNRISTTDLLFRAVACVVEEIEKKDPDYYEKELPEHIKERYSKRFSSFGLSKEKRGEKQAEIVEDGLYLKMLLEKVASEKLTDMKQLEIMETIFDENVSIRTKEVEDKIFVEVEEIQGPRQTIFDPRDSSIKLGIKGKTSWVGSKCHVVETADRGKVNFITDMVYQGANEDDSQIHEKVMEGNDRNGLAPEKLYGDTRYINSDAMHDHLERGTKLMGYIQEDTSKRPEAFKQSNFVVDTEKREAICPAGKCSEKSTTGKDGTIYIYFGRETCTGCAHFQECVRDGCKRKANKRILNVGPLYAYIQERRREQKEKAFKDEMRVRAQVEGTISEAKRFFGLRYAKYRGNEGHQLQFYLTGAALNMKRLAKALINGRDLVQMAEA
jgi:transposase